MQEYLSDNVDQHVAAIACTHGLSSGDDVDPHVAAIACANSLPSNPSASESIETSETPPEAVIERAGVDRLRPTSLCRVRLFRSW